MRTWKWMITASLLMAFSALAQQTAAPASSSEAPMPSAQPASSSAPAEAPAAPLQSAPQPAAVTPAPVGAPTTMDQVVDRAILREHALITFLQTRTPLVETYLQNLKLDQQMGPSPREDHYFFGRLDRNVSTPDQVSSQDTATTAAVW